MKSKHKKRVFQGFSFLEVMVVLTVISLMMGLAIPQFLSLFAKPHEEEYKKLVQLFKLLRNESVLRNCSYELVFDPDKQQYWVESKNSLCQASITRDKFIPNLEKPHFFPEELRLLSVSFASDSNSVFQGTQVLSIHVDSSGFVTQFILVFVEPKSQKMWEVSTSDIMGHLQLKAQ